MPVRDNERIMQGEEPLPDSVNTVSDVPKGFNEWIADNRERAKGWETMPYFVRDNPQYVENFRVDTYSAAERTFTRHYHTSPAMKASMDAYLKNLYPQLETTEMAAIIRDKATRIKKNERDVLLVIKGKSGHPIEDLSMFNGRNGFINQREVLFDKGCRFRFDGQGYDNGRIVLYLTEI